MEFKQGDKYIHFTNNGGVNKGVVEKVFTSNTCSLKNLCVYEVPYMTNTNGITYDLLKDGKFFKIKREFSKEEAERIKETSMHLARHKKQLMVK